MMKQLKSFRLNPMLMCSGDEMSMKLIKKGDLAVIAVVLAAVMVFAFWSNMTSEKVSAVITVDGKVVETVDLSAVKDKREINIETSPKVRIVAENGEIWFENAECEDKLCVASGKLGKAGDTAVCLPSKTVITVSGSEVDAVVY